MAGWSKWSKNASLGHMPSMFCLTKSGAKGETSETHPNDTECWAQLMFGGLNSASLNVFNPTLRAVCRKHFGEALETCGPLLQLQYYLLQLFSWLPPPPHPTPQVFLFSSGRLTWHMWFFFDLEHFGLRLQAWRIKMWPPNSWYVHGTFNRILWGNPSGVGVGGGIPFSAINLLFTWTSPMAEMQ